MSSLVDMDAEIAEREAKLADVNYAVSLSERIFREKLTDGDRRAQEMLANARLSADKIIADARAEAAAIMAKAGTA